MAELKKLLLAFDMPGRWSSHTRKRNRIASGSTSIRVSKETVRFLRDLSIQCRDVHPDWSYSSPPLSELVDWLARGLMIVPDRELTDACKAAIAKTHASTPARTHAKSDVG